MLYKIVQIFIYCLLWILSFAQVDEAILNHQSQIIDALREQQIGNPDKAIDILEKLRHEPDCKAVVYYYLAKINLAKGKNEAAFDAIEESVTTEPGNPWYLLFKAKLCEDAGRTEEAAETYEKLSLLEPVNFSHFDNAAYYYLKTENLKKALEILDKTQQGFGLIPSVAIKKSYVLNLMNKQKLAIEILESCLSQFPSHKELLVELIRLCAEIKNQDALNKNLDKLKALDPDHEELKHWVKKDARDTIQSTEKSLPDLIKSKDTGLDDKMKILFLKLNAFVSNADKSGIQSLLPLSEYLRKEYPADPKTIALIGDIHFQLNDLLQAKEAYAQAVQEGQVPYSVWDNLLFCLIHLNHWRSADYYASKCIDLYPNQSFPHYVFLLSRYKQNQLDNILPVIDQLETMVSYNDHKKTEVLILKAKILSDLKNETESETAWKSAVEMDHDFLAALEYCVFRASKNKGYPTEYFTKAMASEYIHESFKLDKAAELFYFLKDYGKAKQYIENSIAKGYCESADTILLAAKIYEANKESNLSIEFYNKAKAMKESESKDPIQQKSGIR